MPRWVPLLLLTAALTTGCSLRWVVRDDGGDERQHALTQRHRAKLDRLVALMAQAKLAIPLRETSVHNAVGFDFSRDTPALAVHLNGKTVLDNMTAIQRAAASFGSDDETALRLMDQVGLLEANPDYGTLALTNFYKVRDAGMSTDLGAMLTEDFQTVTFYFPLAAAKAYAEKGLPLKELLNRTPMLDTNGQAITGHIY